MQSNQIKRYFITIPLELIGSKSLKKDVAEFVNKKIEKHGAFILSDKQILTSYIGANDIVDEFLDYDFEPIKYDENEWTNKHKEYFNISKPYQLAFDNSKYGHHNVMVDIQEDYLDFDEHIIAVLHAGKDGRYFYCENCHEAQVVYTSNQRFICMSCGCLHCILEKPLIYKYDMKMTADEWFDYFGFNATMPDDEVQIFLVDFQEVENASKLWVTEQWELSVRELIFFSRSTPEEFEKYRGSIITEGQLEALGFSRVQTPVPPASQSNNIEYEINIVRNAATSIIEGTRAYLNGRNNVDELKYAILNLLHAIELLLKIKLDYIDQSDLDIKSNIPQVVKKLLEHGIEIKPDEIEVINRLRKQRNNIQHGESRFTYRPILSLLRHSLIFIDRFSFEELDLWLGDLFENQTWVELLQINEIYDTAEVAVSKILKNIDAKNVIIDKCAKCGKDTLLHTRYDGTICIFCRYKPMLDVDDEDDI